MRDPVRKIAFFKLCFVHLYMSKHTIFYYDQRFRPTNLLLHHKFSTPLPSIFEYFKCNLRTSHIVGLNETGNLTSSPVSLQDETDMLSNTLPSFQYSPILFSGSFNVI